MTPSASRTTERTLAIAEALGDIRAIEASEGVTRVSLGAMLIRLLRLAERTDLFTPEDFPPPEPGAKRSTCLYRLSEDDDHRFALYANAARAGAYASPAHNHTTWAIIAGVSGGDEINRLYARAGAGGVKETGRHVVRPGAGLAFLPDDVHSIHIEAPLLNFHLYGMALEQLPRREFWDAAARTWKVFPPHSDIREARTATA